MIGKNAQRDEEPGYLSYLLRLWCVGGEKGRVWRASLLSAQTRQQVGFAELEALFEYLRAQTAAEADQTSEVSEDLRGLEGGNDGNSVDPGAADL